MAKTNLPLLSAYKAMRRRWGPQGWWPARTRLEMIVGGILTQSTSWVNVEKAIRRLRREKMLTLQALHEVDESTLAEKIRSSGYFNQKARRLKAFTALVVESYSGSLSRMAQLDTDSLRAVLLGIKGIGPETADSILLYAFYRPVFVVDAYTRRFLRRHGWVAESASYDDVSKIFTSQLPAEAQLYNDFHAQIVHLGKEYCRPRPDCVNCPLKRWLPKSRPVELER